MFIGIYFVNPIKIFLMDLPNNTVIFEIVNGSFFYATASRYLQKSPCRTPSLRRTPEYSPSLEGEIVEKQKTNKKISPLDKGEPTRSDGGGLVRKRKKAGTG